MSHAMDISRITTVILNKKLEKLPIINRKKWNVQKNSKICIFVWYKVLSTQISHSQVKNCDRQLETKKYQCYVRKTSKMSIKSVKMKISKNKKWFFSHVTRNTQPKNLVPRSKGLPCNLDTDRQTHTHKNENIGHPFRFSGFFSLTYYQGSIQQHDG